MNLQQVEWHSHYIYTVSYKLVTQHILPLSSVQPSSFIQLLKQGSSKSNKNDVVGYVSLLFVAVVVVVCERELFRFFVPESEWFRFIKLPRKRDSIRLNLYA